MNQNAQQKIESYAEDVQETQTKKSTRLEVVPPTFEEEFNRVQREGSRIARETRRLEREERIMPLVSLAAIVLPWPVGISMVAAMGPFTEAWINQD